ncbi:MAG TPA: thiamine pyrophosphate-binding protein [Pirellulales bacterium]|jgi:benzoylformate decarboxylase|nr:thiamine pyrophosphate-binding protein [Pirellulales bacterium]
MAQLMRGIDAFLDLLAAAGVRHIFGNPGTTELPLNDALAGDPRFQYILGLQEVPLVAMADGFAMASRSLAVVNLHICCGLGNAMGMLYNAFREGTPLLITAGQQDRRLKFEEPILWGRMVDVVRPWKWSEWKICLPPRAALFKQHLRRRLAPCLCRCRWMCKLP